MNYFAIQTRSIETDTEVAELVIRTAHEIGLRFTKIEGLDRFKLGGTEFMRFRVKEGVKSLLDKLFDSGRPTISAEGMGFTARLKGRTGSAPGATMLAAPRRTTVFRGPGAQHWDRQFDESPTS